ncbi:MAG: sigma-70 family RNA polymerase sigma factor [Planctomycetota bacterium]
MDESIEALIEKARDGDGSALAELFDQYRGRLRRMVQLRMDRRVQSRVAESDVLQEAFVDLANQLPNYVKSPKLPFFLWLRLLTGQRLAKIHRMHLQQKKRSIVREVRFSDQIPEASSVLIAAEIAGQFTSAAGHAIREETRLKVQQVLERMSEHDREIISLRSVEQLSNEEIALELGISNKAASMRYIRAIIRLKELLEEVPGILD